MRWCAVAVVALLLAGCGQAAPPASDGPRGGSPGESADTGRGLVRGIGMVIDTGDGPEICLGPVLTSLPPQCGGPRLAGWDWSTIGDAAHRSGVRWTEGEYVVTGRYDGATFTLSEPPLPSADYDGPRSRRSDDADDRLRTPCPEPDGGWRPVDPATTNQRALDEVARVAQQLDGYADLWWDQSLNDSDDEQAMNDPAKLVVNVRVRGDVATAEAELREVWGGALCVTEALRTDAELRRIQDEVSRTPGTMTTSSGHDVVEVDVEYDDGSLQQRFDEEYGPDVVRVHSAIFPVTDPTG